MGPWTNVIILEIYLPKIGQKNDENVENLVKKLHFQKKIGEKRRKCKKLVKTIMSIVAWQTRSQVRSDFFSRLLSRVARFVLVRHEKTREYIPKCPKIYQNGPKIYQNCRKIYQKGPKIYQMTMKCNDIFHSKTLQNIPKLERNYSIWQPGFCPTRSSFDSSRLIRAHSHPSNLLELILIVF
jgi:hypothetical protein